MKVFVLHLNEHVSSLHGSDSALSESLARVIEERTEKVCKDMGNPHVADVYRENILGYLRQKEVSVAYECFTSFVRYAGKGFEKYNVSWEAREL